MRILVNDHAGHPFQLQLSRALARAGHSVLHLYFADNISTPKGQTRIQPNDPPTLSIKGLSIRRKFKKHSPWARRLADIDYGKSASAQVQTFQPDVVLSSNTPLDAQKIILRAAQFSNAGFVFWVQDLLSMAISFVLRRKRIPFSSLVVKRYSRLERRLLLASDAVVPIAPEFCDVLGKWGISPSQTFVVENWAPLNEVRPMSHPTPWAKEMGVAGKFCFLYSGQLGMKHRPELLLQLAKHFEGSKDVVTVVVADGAGADWLRQHSNVSPESLRLFPLQPYERLSEVLGAGDVLISILDSDCGAFAVPSKTLSYLCAGRPLLLAAPPQNLATKIIRLADAGIVVAGDDAAEFAAAAAMMFDCAEARDRWAANARIYAESTFDIDKIVQRFMVIFRLALEKRGTACAVRARELAHAWSSPNRSPV